MVNTMDKMRRTQANLKKFLLKEYDMVYNIHHTRWSKDIFGLFDGFAVRPDEILFVQYKSNAVPNLNPYREFYFKYRLPWAVLVWVDGKGIKCYGSMYNIGRKGLKTQV